MSGLALALLIALGVLQALDWWTTARVLGQGGREANPIVAALMRAVGDVDVALAIKTVVVMVLGYWLASASLTMVLAGLCAGFVIIVLLNFRQIK